jgi:hypothetical protein
MLWILLRATFDVAVLIAPIAAVAGISLSPVMQSCDHGRHAIAAMLEGRTPFNSAERSSAP